MQAMAGKRFVYSAQIGGVTKRGQVLKCWPNTSTSNDDLQPAPETS